ncbi:MAG: hypothetical protein ABIP88_10405, partial [Candidatus Binatia bacterium]
FNQPRQSAIALEEKTKTPVGEIHGRCAKRQTRFSWKKNGRVRPIRSDKKQLASIKRPLFYCHSCHFLSTLDGFNVTAVS